MSKILDLWSDMTGVVLDYALSTPPSDKWLMCYGQALLSTDTAAARLRAKLLADGSPYGTDGSGNPFVPDARGRAIAGKDDMGGVAASRLTSGGAGVDGATLGAAGGSQTHTLTTAQMPTHAHGITDPGHGHSVGYEITVGSGTDQRSGATDIINNPAPTTTSTTGITVQNNGSGDAHPITQPTLVLNKIIRL